jgi:hypothetical protein
MGLGGVLGGSGSTAAPPAVAAPAAAESAVEDYAAKYPLQDPEPAAGDGTTRVQIRLVGNQSCVRRFNTSEKVGVLMTLVSQKVPEALQKPFILNNSFPRKVCVVCACVCVCVFVCACFGCDPFSHFVFIAVARWGPRQDDRGGRPEECECHDGMALS